jgi:dehydratase
VRTALAATCQATAIGQTSTSALDSGVTVEGPSSVASGANFQVKLTADPIVVPTSGGGFSINNLNTVRIRFTLPAGTTYVGATLSGGALLGSGTPSVAVSGSQIVLSVPGNLSPGTTATLPTVVATLKATGAAGGSIPLQLAGTGYASPGISFTARVAVLFGVDAVTNCYVPNNPVLKTIAIV